ncbi:NYN domain-containing protein [Candidatus Magnetominusculus xianensis]|uniref:NYN domain-containing protein n=1 Tax=Candidatus Magnetominusculus xianensis TaxID=1748249 RepID=A0ABR5SIJ2_9BACT|nr:NYN domain-containing protein [Candidatus Magnetominusculus xianensis]KWT89413.1 NYN domain-containing protein [Candidatus Magnetominusculus xianensis]MBF0405502.1 NYN domain-containing protein [Nitrospirota bacterium]
MEKKVFIFWDNSNIFISGRTVASEKEGEDASYQLRLQFNNILELASAGRDIECAIAVGSVPPELRHVWNKMEQSGIKVELHERGLDSNKEQAVDQALQVHMLRKAFDYNGTPGIAVMLTGDGHGFLDGVGFHADLERMHKKGWGIEVIAWERTCNSKLKKWASEVGTFIRLEDYYESVTFRDDYNGVIRRSKPLNLDNRIKST